MRPFIVFVFAMVLTGVCAAIPAQAGQRTHTVVRGDSLWSIASRNHVTLASLETRNHLTDQSILRLGSVLVIGAAKAQTAGRFAVAPNHGRLAMNMAARPTSVTRHALPARASVRAANNAMWVATHSGEAPAPPALQSYALAQRIVAFDEKVTHTALRFVGVPYVWGGTSFSGVDCSGFVQTVFERNGIPLPRTADSQFEVGRPVRLSDLEAGDLVFFQTYAPGASHVGIYLGSGRFIHASSSYGVRVDALGEDYYAARYVGARRLIR